MVGDMEGNTPSSKISGVDMYIFIYLTYKQDPGPPGHSAKLAPPSRCRGVLEPPGGSWGPKKPPLGTSGIPRDPREAREGPQDAKREPKGSQKASKRVTEIDNFRVRTGHS